MSNRSVERWPCLARPYAVLLLGFAAFVFPSSDPDSFDACHDVLEALLEQVDISLDEVRRDAIVHCEGVERARPVFAVSWC